MVTDAIDGPTYQSPLQEELKQSFLDTNLQTVARWPGSVHDSRTVTESLRLVVKTRMYPLSKQLLSLSSVQLSVCTKRIYPGNWNLEADISEFRD